MSGFGNLPLAFPFTSFWSSCAFSDGKTVQTDPLIVFGLVALAFAVLSTQRTLVGCRFDAPR